MFKDFLNPYTQLIKIWKEYHAPWVPEGEELKIFEKFFSGVLKRSRSKRTLVLGATPQLRDLGHKFKAEVTVVDISMEMIIGLSYLIKDKKSVNRETWVRGNWLTAPLEKNSGRSFWVIG